MTLENAVSFREKIQNSEICLGTVITFSDPTITEALSNLLDFVWIDMEHSVLTLEMVQGHVMATKASNATPLVRVPWNDPVLIKPVLDIGAAGIIVPFVRNAEDVRRAVAACLYPPAGVRGFGPRRAANYGFVNAVDYCKQANENGMVFVQIEHIDAVTNLDEIISVSGLTGIVIGPNDLAGSMGYTAQPRHPQVTQVIETIISKTQGSGLFIGIAIGDDPEQIVEWIDKGVQWLAMGVDYTLLLKGLNSVIGGVRSRLP
jgi:2-keto-3-deoxy-L-rhamnonate aldolase RhmA